MSCITNNPFNYNDRIGNDACDLSQNNIQNSKAANYLLTNLNVSCPMNQTVQCATSQPAINYTGTFQVGMGGCNIDDNSLLHITDLTRNKCKINLFQRPFVTVPYLGRGKSNAVLESQLQQGELANNRKSINPSSEVSYQNYQSTPLIPSLQATINNPANLVEGVAQEGWIRGGIPVRQLTKDTCF